MSGPNTIPMGDVPMGFSAQASDRSGAQLIQIDNGKAVMAVAICAALCGICAAISITTVWHSETTEINMESQYRKTQNHVDEMTNEVKRLRDRLEDREHAAR